MKLKTISIVLLTVLSLVCSAKGEKTRGGQEQTPATQNTIENLEYDLRFFEDSECTTLKRGVRNTKKFRSVALRDLADRILAGEYSAEYLCAEYRALPSPMVLSREYRLGDGFSKYENITGVYLEGGENVLLVSGVGERKVSLLLPDLMRQPSNPSEPTRDSLGWGLLKQVVVLRDGVNVINVEKSSNAYIHYFEDDYAAAPEVSVHFVTGLVNGYFDLERGDDNAKWDELLASAVSPIMDARGKHIHVAYPVEWFVEYTSGRGVELMTNYDSLVNAQYELMGLVKYDNVPLNRVFARVNFNYYMFRDRDGVAYLGNKGTMRMVADPVVVINGDPCWGFSHEVGHIMQMHPMTWGGMTEVSNNIFTLYAKRKMGNSPSRIMRQGNYKKAQDELVGKGIAYLLHSDVFDRLVPFWQLQLYFEGNGMPDFYPELMEHLRRTAGDYKGDQTIQYQFEFIKACCDVSKTNLLDFFEKWGFFVAGDLVVKDYGTYNFSITQDMIDSTREYVLAKGYPEPSIDITTISE